MTPFTMKVFSYNCYHTYIGHTLMLLFTCIHGYLHISTSEPQTDLDIELVGKSKDQITIYLILGYLIRFFTYMYVHFLY